MYVYAPGAWMGNIHNKYPQLYAIFVGSEVLIAPPRSATVALGGEALFVCNLTSIQEPIIVVYWYVQLPGGEGFNWPYHLEVLQRMGIVAETTGLSSHLGIPATKAMNGTTVQCTASLQLEDVSSDFSSVFIFGELYI